MYWTMRKGGREVRVHSKFRVVFLQLLGWRKTFRFEGSE